MESLTEVAISKIEVSQTESQIARRAQIKKDGIDELTDSVTTHGVLQPIIVRPRNGAKYELVAGERRFMAAGAAKLKRIPAVVRKLTDEQVIEVQLIENLQRADLHPMQEAEGYQELMKKHGHPIEDLHTRVGKSRSYVYGRIKLLALSAPARKAFYADKISASVALLIARIPTPKLQNEALSYCVGSTWNGPVSYRRAQEHVQSRYMLRLKGAPFSPSDPDLVKKAGACGNCPKRTGNQKELFGDVKSADVCTDPVCFALKAKTAGNLRIAKAKEAGQAVIVGAAARKVAPHGGDRYLSGYLRASDKNYSDTKARTNRSIVGRKVKTVLLQDQDGIVYEVYKESTVNAALRKNKPKSSKSTGDNTHAAAKKKADNERKYRVALYEALRSKLRPPTVKEMAREIFEALDTDDMKFICELRDFKPPKKKHQWGGGTFKDYEAIGKTIDKMSNAEALRFINDCLHAREIYVPTYTSSKPKRLLAAAKRHKINTRSIRAKVRREASKPKKKAGKKS